MAISVKELPKNHTDKEQFAAASCCIAMEILTLLFARKQRRSTVPVLYQPPCSRSRRVPDLKVPNDLKIWRLRTTEYGWTCAAHFWSTGSSTDRTMQKNEVKMIAYIVQTTVKAAVSILLSLDSICLSKKLEIPLYVVWQIK